MSEPGLDFAFLKYIGYRPELQQAHLRFYVPFFTRCQSVVDLGCGTGDFVDLLAAQDIHAVGVDSDPVACQSMRERGLEVANQDVLAYLHQLEAGSIDGVFASHLVEHLDYQSVCKLMSLSYRALKPGGVIVLTTPDPHSLYAHLEMFYLHFGHVTFYDPRLLCFFLERAGFADPVPGNPESPVHPESPLFNLHDMKRIGARPPAWKSGVLHRLLRVVRTAVAYLFLNPYLDLIDSNFRQLSDALRRVDRPFECYAKALKLPPGEAERMKG
jgi:SAM-dependent methyltransferase